MGLINTNHKQLVKSFTSMQKDLLKNPLYLFNDKKAHIVNYFNLNTNLSVMDEALKIPYAQLGSDSPLRYNRINNFYLFGLNQIDIGYEIGDWGLESNDISGEALILPNTITPYPGDYFTLDISKQRYLFKVIDITIDTLENGANVYKISYKLDRLADDSILELVVEEYEYYPEADGSNFKSVILKSKWDFAKELDNASVQLKNFYVSLFYNSNVQTFTNAIQFQNICNNNLITQYLYDPYLIEFAIHNKLLSNSSNYIYVGHKTRLPAQFPILYSKSIWAALQSKDMNILAKCLLEISPDRIMDQGTIFYSRIEDYFEGRYEYFATSNVYSFGRTIKIFDTEIVDKILKNETYHGSEDKAMYNIIIKYFNDEPFTIDDIFQYTKVQNMDLSTEYFYLLIMIIFCMDMTIKKLLAKT